MNYEEQLAAMLAPQEIVDAAKRIDASGERFSKDDMAALQKWYRAQMGQNRYGK